MTPAQPGTEQPGQSGTGQPGQSGTRQPGQAGPASRLLAVNFAACLLLLIQYLLGMAVNLYVSLPAAHPGAAAPDYFTGAASGLAWVIPDGPAWAGVHAAFGLVLVAAAFIAIALGRGQRGRMTTVLSAVGALAILGAAFNGVSFLNYGHAFSSMIMASLWALALACYLTGMFLAARPAGTRKTLVSRAPIPPPLPQPDAAADIRTKPDIVRLRDVQS